jgi:hypothetical protein
MRKKVFKIKKKQNFAEHTDESKPSVNNIKKKNTAQTGAHGIVAIASG